MRRRFFCSGLKAVLFLAGVGFWHIVLATTVFANNVAVSNVELKSATASTVVVEFDLSQNNPFGNLTDANSAAFSDYIWVFIKYDTDTIAEETSGWQHATLQQAGSSAAFNVASDGKGAFIKAADANINLQLVWNYAANGVVSTAMARVKVMAMEMVYIPQGQFVYNAGGIGGSTFNNYGGGAESTISLATHVPTGASSGWPNGYNAFYLAKYEVSQGQYADFLNAIDATNATTRFPNQTTYRHTITYTGGNAYGLRYAASIPNRACNFLSWDDATAYASWAALRPMTEMEFEKAGRGGGTNTNTYPWGNTAPSTTTYTFDGATFSQYYANYNNTSGGPVNVGHYLSADIARSNEQTGASPYGVTDLAGNDWEHLINCASIATAANGSGALSPPASWPGAASGKGIRGGCWDNTSSYLRVSDRYNAGWTDTTRNFDVGFRAARTP